jgi:GT2 family glycosyltransferase
LIHAYGVYKLSDWDLEQPHEVDALLGACILLRRSVLDQVGLLDEDYFMYTEEIDLCTRIQKAGWKLYWIPQAKIIHYGGQSTQQAAPEMFLALYESKINYFRKHYNWITTMIYKMILFIVSLTRLMLFPLAKIENDPKRQRHLDTAQNYRQLIGKLSSM